MASDSSSALAASITGERLERRLPRALRIRLGGFLPPHVGRGRRPQGLRQQALAAVAAPPSLPTASRVMPMRVNKACMANCGCPDAGAMRLLSSPAISFHDSSSRSVSRPGSTTAPWGSRAIVAMSSAVAGIEPVEPAAITGASVLRASRAASALINASRRSTASMMPRSFKISGQAWCAICRNFERAAANIRRGRPAPDSSSRSHGTPRVVMSSISRARSSASAQAVAGVWATSGAPLSRAARARWPMW